jgi:hypothetical protein
MARQMQIAKVSGDLERAANAGHTSLFSQPDITGILMRSMETISSGLAFQITNVNEIWC